MSVASGGEQHRAELTCFGAVVAGLSHELNNALATVAESAGLLEDYVAGATRGRPIDPARFERTSARIHRCIDRTEHTISLLNGFAHTVDRERSVVDLGAATRAIAELCQHQAKRRRLALEAACEGQGPAVEGNAFEVHHLIFRAVAAAMDRARPGATIRLDCGEEGCEACLVVTFEEAGPDDAAGGASGDLLRVLAAALGAGVAEVANPPDGPCIRVMLPRRLGRAGEGGGDPPGAPASSKETS